MLFSVIILNELLTIDALRIHLDIFMKIRKDIKTKKLCGMIEASR